MTTRGRVIAPVAFLEKDHSRKAADLLAKGELSIGQRTFELIPDLQIMQTRVRESGLCAQCVGGAATERHGYGCCYATDNKREATC